MGMVSFLGKLGRFDTTGFWPQPPLVKGTLSTPTIILLHGQLVCLVLGDL